MQGAWASIAMQDFDLEICRTVVEFQVIGSDCCVMMVREWGESVMMEGQCESRVLLYSLLGLLPHCLI